MKMKKEDLRNSIRKHIINSLIEKSKHMNHTIKKSQEDITEEDLDSILFKRADGEDSRKFVGLLEAMENQQNTQAPEQQAPEQDNIQVQNTSVTTSEIKDFEQSFIQAISDIPNCTIKFDKQKNNYSLLVKRNSGEIEVMSSGELNFGNKGKLNWMLSLRNGCKVKTENLAVDQDSRNILDAFYNFYQTWQKNWRERVNSLA
jgi:hypothetical protein